MRQTIEEIRSVFKDKELKKPENREKRNARLRALVDERFDYEEMSKRTLARYWRERTPEERKEFISLYSDLLKNIYLKRIKKHEDELERHEDDKVLYQDEKVEDPYAAVRTLIITYDGKEIPVEYRLLKKDGDWKAYDVLIEGVSLLNNYRTQFGQIIRSSSYEELVKRIKAKKIVAPDEKEK
ncbi:MAG: ABC transporter substrate-binding protein [Alphaproteobacteria bacterium]|uniref:ABC transporter substrate-binding protein n=1 Tax=Candidatus Nitrobium versatile TaxID=2884831 RepID=A0A953M1G5_9BACT|nr:ABC transporter substrate-binding protein [Candidatus Nitrobium versatile]